MKEGGIPAVTAAAEDAGSRGFLRSIRTVERASYSTRIGNETAYTVFATSDLRGSLERNPAPTLVVTGENEVLARTRGWQT